MWMVPESLDKTPRLGDPKVLLIEDDPVTRWMVRLALKSECVLATAQDAGKAVSLYLSYRPDMVLLDIGLPGRDGKELLVRLMKIDPGAYVVMFSSQDTAQNVVETIQNGARGFISKPFSRNKLMEYVHACPTGR